MVGARAANGAAGVGWAGRLVAGVGIAALGGLLCGCPGSGGAPAVAGTAGAKLRVVATVGMVADAARIIGGDRVEVTALMGPGVDPHLYKASQTDIAALTEAQLVLYVGLGLEGKMADLLSDMASRKATVAVGEAIPKERLRHPDGAQGHADPHVWFDVGLWKLCAGRVGAALAEADPSGKAKFEAETASYLSQLELLDAEARTELATIPKERRVLITSHDAFGYLGRAYDVEVVGLQGISTAAEAGLQDVTRLVDLIVGRKIPAVFVETSLSDRALRSVMDGAKARGHDVRIGGSLYSDALGEAGTPEGTYIGAVRHNIRAIVGALK